MRLKLFSVLAVAALVATACTSSPAATANVTATPAASAPASAAASTPASAAAGSGTLRATRLADWYNYFHPVEFQTGDQFQWWSCIFNTLVTVSDDSKTLTPGL